MKTSHRRAGLHPNNHGLQNYGVVFISRPVRYADSCIEAKRSTALLTGFHSNGTGADGVREGSRHFAPGSRHRSHGIEFGTHRRRVIRWLCVVFRWPIARCCNTPSRVRGQAPQRLLSARLAKDAVDGATIGRWIVCFTTTAERHPTAWGCIVALSGLVDANHAQITRVCLRRWRGSFRRSFGSFECF